MLNDKNILEQHLDAESVRLISDSEKCKALYDFINETYNVPKSIVADFILSRKSFSEASEFILFCILDGLEYLNNTKKSKMNEYFTNQEIQTYKNAKFEVETVKFPLVFKMIQISYDQWVGRISIKELMSLRKAQLINYNVNAQRTMQHIIKGSKEIYKIALNWAAIRQIEKSYESQQFIPNTLTLNIPVNENNVFYYDATTSSLIINELEHFDITDGYHRYIAACQCNDRNPDFDYEMELRIINFSEDKARYFIFQEDQKTKMKKVDSNSLNMTKAANIVATKVNDDYKCNVQGLISRNEGLISLGELAEVIDYFYFKEIGSKEKERILIISTTKKIVDMFNVLTEYDTKYLEKRYSFKLLTVIIYCFYEYSNWENEKICKLIDCMYERIGVINSKKFHSKKVRKTLINDIEKLAKECEQYV